MGSSPAGPTRTSALWSFRPGRGDGAAAPGGAKLPAPWQIGCIVTDRSQIGPRLRRRLVVTAWMAMMLASACGSPAASPAWREDAGRTSIDADPDVAASAPAEEGSPCVAEGTLVCGLDVRGKTDNLVLYCGGSIYQSVFQCPGSEACANIAGHDQVRCGGPTGTYFATPGAPCSNELAQACSFDQQVVLKCSQGAWLTAIHCSPSTCANLPQTSNGCAGTWCGNCGYTPGDLCSFPDGSARCSTDLSKIVQCSNGTVTVWRDCGVAECTAVESDGGATLACQ